MSLLFCILLTIHALFLKQAPLSIACDYWIILFSLVSELQRHLVYRFFSSLQNVQCDLSRVWLFFLPFLLSFHFPPSLPSLLISVTRYFWKLEIVSMFVTEKPKLRWLFDNFLIKLSQASHSFIIQSPAFHTFY